jgi:hypothetical protein
MSDRKDQTTQPANADMVEGYRDGFDLSSPEPSDNRSHSYRHGFANGRDDRAGKPRGSYTELVRMADLAMEKDRNIEAMRATNNG